MITIPGNVPHQSWNPYPEPLVLFYFYPEGLEPIYEIECKNIKFKVLELRQFWFRIQFEILNFNILVEIFLWKLNYKIRMDWILTISLNWKLVKNSATKIIRIIRFSWIFLKFSKLHFWAIYHIETWWSRLWKIWNSDQMFIGKTHRDFFKYFFSK